MPFVVQAKTAPAIHGGLLLDNAWADLGKGSTFRKREDADFHAAEVARNRHLQTRVVKPVVVLAEFGDRDDGDLRKD